MGVELPLRNDQHVNGLPPAGTPTRSPLASKKRKVRPEGEASLCAIRITREEARAANQRLEPRREAEQPVEMGFRGDETGATVLNISSKGAKVRCCIEPFIGEPLELTFPGDERIQGVVRWVRDGCIGVEFGALPATAAIAAAAEPPVLHHVKLADTEAPGQSDADDASGPAGNRSAKRARVLLAAKLEIAGGMVDARLRDLSCKGALLECGFPLAIGDAVVFSRGETVVPARVAWTTNGRIGIEFDRPIEESEVLVHVNRGPPPPPQNHIQAMEQARASTEFRRPSFSDRLTDYDRKLARVVGASLGVSLIDE